jgi:hypothetical protein
MIPAACLNATSILVAEFTTKNQTKSTRRNTYQMRSVVTKTFQVPKHWDTLKSFTQAHLEKETARLINQLANSPPKTLKYLIPQNTTDT